MRRIIVITFYLLTALIPLIFTSSTYELFEFPKFLVLLSGAFIIGAAWLIHAVTNRDWALRRPGTPRYLLLIDWGVIAVLLTQIITTITSIHPYTSFWGYYSRFHQGLLTTILYTILYFAAVKWLDKQSTQKIINISIKTSIFISLIAVFEHYNFSLTCLLMTSLSHFQNVADPIIGSTACWGGLTNPLYRSFATLGQPNWLAAYLLPNLFLLFYSYQAIISKNSKNHFLFYLSLITLFLALIFTGSRSGFIALGLSLLVYWFLSLRHQIVSRLRPLFLVSSILIILIIGLFGSPFTPPITSYLHSASPTPTPVETGGTALETGGTNSGDIRKIVWSGALQLIKKHSILGTGPETFAYTYYWVRPVAHNYTSEWDYLYNKAHNEYLNIAAGSGLLGLAAYLLWHYAIFAASFAKISSSKKTNKENETRLVSYLPILAASVVSFAVTNFFGFSVIPVYFMLILVPAFVQTINQEEILDPPGSASQLGALAAISSIFLVLLPGRLFLADYYFNKGKNYLAVNRPTDSISYLARAVALRPSEDLFHSYLGEAYATVGNKDKALIETQFTSKHNPYHLNYYKSRAKVYLAFSESDPSFYRLAAQELEAARRLAPTDPKLAYNLGLVYSRLGDLTNTEKQMYDAIELKKNYQEPYYALALIYEQTKHPDKIPALMQTARENLATYSGLLKEKMDKYSQARSN